MGKNTSPELLALNETLLRIYALQRPSDRWTKLGARLGYSRRVLTDKVDKTTCLVLVDADREQCGFFGRPMA